MADVTDLSEYREGWRDMPDDTYVAVEMTLVQCLSVCLNVPDRVERLREILDRSNYVFESSDDLVEFVKQSSFLEVDDEEEFVMIRASFVEQALDAMRSELDGVFDED
jgi:hypothetical protein